MEITQICRPSLAMTELSLSRAVRKIVGVLVSVVLIAAAVLKVAAFVELKSHVVGYAGLASASMLGIALIEILIGICILFQETVLIAWYASISFFIIAFLYNIYLLLAGAATCGCFGALSPSPAGMAAIDFLLVGCLIAFRPARRSSVDKTRWVEAIGAHFVVIAAIIAVGAGLRWKEAMEQRADSAIWAKPRAIELGSVAVGAKHEIAVELNNRRHYPVTILGARVSCPCIALDKLPATIPAAETLSVHAIVSPPAGPFQGTITFFTTDRVVRQITLRYYGLGVDSAAFRDTEERLVANGRSLLR